MRLPRGRDAIRCDDDPPGRITADPLIADRRDARFVTHPESHGCRVLNGILQCILQ